MKKAYAIIGAIHVMFVLVILNICILKWTKSFVNNTMVKSTPMDENQGVVTYLEKDINPNDLLSNNIELRKRRIVGEHMNETCVNCDDGKDRIKGNESSNKNKHKVVKEVKERHENSTIENDDNVNENKNENDTSIDDIPIIPPRPMQPSEQSEPSKPLEEPEQESQPSEPTHLSNIPKTNDNTNKINNPVSEDKIVLLSKINNNEIVSDIQDEKTSVNPNEK